VRCALVLGNHGVVSEPQPLEPVGLDLARFRRIVDGGGAELVEGRIEPVERNARRDRRPGRQLATQLLQPAGTDALGPDDGVEVVLEDAAVGPGQLLACQLTRKVCLPVLHGQAVPLEPVGQLVGGEQIALVPELPTGGVDLFLRRLLAAGCEGRQRGEPLAHLLGQPVPVAAQLRQRHGVVPPVDVPADGEQRPVAPA
jgi:hypothetical protein